LGASFYVMGKKSPEIEKREKRTYASKTVVKARTNNASDNHETHAEKFENQSKDGKIFKGSALVVDAKKKKKHTKKLLRSCDKLEKKVMRIFGGRAGNGPRAAAAPVELGVFI